MYFKFINSPIALLSEIFLTIQKYATSNDGHCWTKHGQAVPYIIGKAQAFSKPSVWKDNANHYHMYFSYRGNPNISYRMSYAKMNRVREDKYNKAKEMGYELVSYISSKCTYISQYPPGDNCFILEDNTIQPYVKIGNDVTLWSGNHIGHDSTLEDHIFIASQVVVSGHVKIKSNVFIGVNATLRDNITIEKNTLIGAGAIIMKDTKEKEVYSPERTKPYSKKSDEIDF